MTSRLLAAVACLGILVSGCSAEKSSSPTAPGTDSSSASLFNGMAASKSPDSRFGVVIAHENGEKVGGQTEAGDAGKIQKVTGAAYISPGGGSAVVFAGDDGLPRRTVFGDVVVLYANYTSSTVDVAIVANGAYKVARAVPVDADILAALESLPPQLTASAVPSVLTFSPAAVSTSLELAITSKLAGALLSAAGCSAVGGAGDTSIPWATLSCGSTIVKPIFDSLKSQVPALERFTATVFV